MLLRWPQGNQCSLHVDHQVQVSCTSQVGQAGKQRFFCFTFQDLISLKVLTASQTFLAKLGIPAHDPILSARPAILAHQKVLNHSCTYLVHNTMLLVFFFSP